jgi:hypothetical protein
MSGAGPLFTIRLINSSARQTNLCPQLALAGVSCVRIELPRRSPHKDYGNREHYGKDCEKSCSYCDNCFVMNFCKLHKKTHAE